MGEHAMFNARTTVLSAVDDLRFEESAVCGFELELDPAARATHRCQRLSSGKF